MLRRDEFRGEAIVANWVLDSNMYFVIIMLLCTFICSYMQLSDRDRGGWEDLECVCMYINISTVYIQFIYIYVHVL